MGLQPSTEVILLPCIRKYLFVVRNLDMTKKLKIILAILLALLLVQHSFGQDTSKLLNTTWQTLKAQLSRRTNLSNRLAKILEPNEKPDTSIIEQLKANTVLLRDLLDLDKIDSITITKIHDRNDSLSISISKGVDVLQTDKSLIPTNEFEDIAIQLEGTENRIYIAIRDFNEICKNNGRYDLYFKKPLGDTEAIEIKND